MIGLMRMPMNGGSVPATQPAAPPRCAAVAAWPSSSSSGAVAVAVLEVDAEILDGLARSLSRTRCITFVASSPRMPSASRERVRVGRVVSSARSASSPSFFGVSAVNRCAPP